MKGRSRTETILLGVGVVVITLCVLYLLVTVVALVSGWAAVTVVSQSP